MRIIDYDRNAVLSYAEKWAYKRNPNYYDFSNIGGDCTNFASQCIFAGAKIMNYTKNVGWYYNSPSSRSPSWTGVEFLKNFLLGNNGENGYIGNGVGPYAVEVAYDKLEIGDVVQLAKNNDFFHTAIVVGFSYGIPLVSAHTNNVFDFPLNEYYFEELKCLHIAGVRI